jgi:hypothetical protein
LTGRRPQIARRAAILGAALLTVAIPACSSSPTGSASPRQLTVPLATGLEAGGGTWATVAMGHLGDQDNTFWQLLYRPKGSTQWTNEVSATATATNGGLVLASSGSALTVGVRPYDLLGFSPLISTTDGGRKWSDSVVPKGLADVPGSLAIGAGNGAIGALALVGSPADSTEVLSSGPGLATWNSLISRSGLFSSGLSTSGQAVTCAPTAIDAVALLGGDAVIGASCAGPGVAGIFRLAEGSWQPAGPASQTFAGATVQVLSLSVVGGVLDALLGVTRPGSTELVAAWGGPTPGSWRLSPPLALQGDASIASIVAAPAPSMMVLLGGPSGGDRLESVAGPAAPWQQLPAPPAGTQTVVPTSGGALSALSVANSTLTDWELSEGSGSWAKGQVLQVTIAYGSSS